ncbi:MAG: GTP-binding protein, partial [Lachnospiraceae bacterium]|nr:GTP-binding protein [Lachnospiraceae bacterium]
MEKKIVAGLVADADAGKTTLTESLLYKSGTIRNQGRVDHRDAFLDTFHMEKERGITIFSKTAVMELENTHVTIVDTPGHGDFSSEMERTLWVLDYAVLLISQSDGITGQCRLLWNLLRTYGVPTIIFVNKTDRPDFDKERSFKEIRETFGSSCIDFSAGTGDVNVLEELALSDQELLDKHLSGGAITDPDIRRLLREEKIFPVLFGSGLKNAGTEELLALIDRYTEEKEPEEEFGGKIYKISRDEKGNRLTWIKLTGGTLKVKDAVATQKDDEIFEEKCEQL